MWAERSTLDEVPDRILALDHLGVQLAIHWGSAGPAYEGAIRSNVNMFRYVFSYLGGSQSLLQNLAPDDGFVVRGRGEASEILQAVRDGKPLQRLEVLAPRAAGDPALD